MTIKGLKMWCFTLIEYDEFGGAKIVKSFMKPAKDSPIKGGAVSRQKKQQMVKTEEAGEVSLF